MKAIVSTFISVFMLSFLFSCNCSKKNSVSEKPENVKNKKSDNVQSVTVTNYLTPSQLDYTINSAELADSIMKINVTYKGGCGKHTFNLLFNGMYAKSLPMQATLFLQHKAEKETCTEDITETLTFNISNVRSSSYNKIIVKLHGYSNSFTYIYPKP